MCVPLALDTLCLLGFYFCEVPLPVSVWWHFSLSLKMVCDLSKKVDQGDLQLSDGEPSVACCLPSLWEFPRIPVVPPGGKRKP